LARKRRWTISRVRGNLYALARILGDVQAVASGDPRRMAKRVARRLVWRSVGRVLGRLFR
jgi:hypothetical protein